MKKQVLLIALSLLMFASCGNLWVSPNTYQEEIEDCVKYKIALLMVMADTYSKYEKDVKSASWFTSAFFGEGLTKYAAEKRWEKYNAIDVIISDYKKVETSSDTKIWKFTELNTGLVCKFWIESDNKWYCDITESSMEKFFNNLIQ
ncbi:MAG: hypothetical protein J5605_08880 [Bacteroidales bacterium]|nr:hypothetical protein [Bacteroidales bacterium]